MRRSDLFVGAIAALANPYVAGFWLAVGGGVTVSLSDGGERAGLAVFFAGFLLACLLWVTFVAALVTVAHRRVNRGFLRAANLFAAIILAAFAILLVAKLGRDLI
jgi:threonine/homoserine/homoserine lactone efflux protein